AGSPPWTCRWTAGRTGRKRPSRRRLWTRCSRAFAIAGTGTATRRSSRAAPWTAPATCSRRSTTSRRSAPSPASFSTTMAFFRGRSPPTARSRMRSRRALGGGHRRPIRHAPLHVAAAVAIAALAAACAATPRTLDKPPAPATGFGTPISEADIAAWDIDIRASDGGGLPPGRGSVAQGKAVYESMCLTCHGAEAKGGSVYGPMVGGIGSFTTDRRVLPPGSMYPYAPILFDYIRRTMPMDKPQTMTSDDIYAVSAYILHLNGLAPADAVMDATSLPKVQMPNRDGFIADDRPDTRAVRCMQNCR